MPATEYEIADQIDRSTAELLRENDDAVLAWGETAVYRLEEKETEVDE